MTKKDFELIAEIIRSLPDTTSREGIAWKFSQALATANPRFNVKRFIEACSPDN